MDEIYKYEREIHGKQLEYYTQKCKELVEELLEDSSLSKEEKEVCKKKISKEEEYAVKEMNADQTKGTKEVSVLFEEMDGVWLNMQGEAHSPVHHQK